MGDMALALALTRDSGSGRVTIDSSGAPQCSYWPSKRDRAGMVKVGAWLGGRVDGSCWLAGSHVCWVAVVADRHPIKQ